MRGLHDIAIITPGVIRVKDAGVLRGLMERRFDPTLIEVADYISEKYGMVITESYRPRKHQNDLHGTDPVRALDGRIWQYETVGVADRIAADVNSRWEYDPGRPHMKCVIIHRNACGDGRHMHIQVHPKTRRREIDHG